MPSFNHAAFLPAAVESVLAQTLDDFELLIADDASTDDSLAVARGYAARYPDRVRVLTHADGANHGPGATMNLLTRECRGAYRATLASDDVYLPERLERHHRFLDARPDLAWVYGPVQAVADDGKPIDLELGYDITRVADPVASFIERNPCNGIAVLARMAAIRETGEHAEDVLFSDWDFWLRLFLARRPAYLPGALVLKRVHGANASISTQESGLLHAIALLRHLRGSVGPALAPRHRALIGLRLCHQEFLAGEVPRARESLRGALTEDPELPASHECLVEWLVSTRARDGQGVRREGGDRFVAWFVEAVRDGPHEQAARIIAQDLHRPLLQLRVRECYARNELGRARALVVEGWRRGDADRDMWLIYARALLKGMLGARLAAAVGRVVRRRS